MKVRRCLWPVVLVVASLGCGGSEPTEQSVLMRDALTAAGRRVELFLVPGHGFTAAEEAVARPVADAFLATELR